MHENPVFQVAAEVLGRETILMELVAVPDMEDEGVPVFLMGEFAMVAIHMAMQTFLVNWEVEQRDPIPQI